MAKKNKKYKIKKSEKKENEEKDSPQSKFIGEYARSPRKERTPEQKKEYIKLAVILFGTLILAAIIYFTFVLLENETLWLIVMTSYSIIGIVFLLLWVIFNGGLKKFDPDSFEKPAGMGYDEFCEFIETAKERNRKSKYFFALSMPFFIVIIIDFILLYWG